MAIQPIDLSTVYSQMDNVSKINNNNLQAAQVASREYVESLQKQEFQNQGAVHAISSDKEESRGIKERRDRESEKGKGSSEKKEHEDDENAPKKNVVEVKDPRVGRIIDIIG